MIGSLGMWDYVVLAAYFVGVLAIGLWSGRSERNTNDYFLGGRRQHWLIVGLSIVATEVSALTFIGVPADAFAGDWNYLQMYAGAFVGRILIVIFLLPAFYAHRVTTVYEFLGRRFGPQTRTTASLMFFASRIVGSGIRLLAASIAIATVFDWPLVWVIVASAAVAVGYTTFGGIKSVIWTDALQALVFIGGGIATVIWLLYVSSDGSSGRWTDSLAAASDARKLRVVTWSMDPNNVKCFWVLLISSTFTNMAALGTDQDLTQRMLTCPDVRRSQRSLIFNAFLGLPIVCLFLLIGTLLASYYASGTGHDLPVSVTDNPRLIFPHFIATALPSGWGLKGLLVAGVFAAAMSSLDSALGAMSSTAVTDFYKPYLHRRAKRPGDTPHNETPDDPILDDHKLLIAARWFSLGFGVLLIGVALGFSNADELLWVALRWAGLLFGAMLGVFLLAVLTRTRGHDTINVVAMLSSTAALVALKYYQESHDRVIIAWPWWVVIGTIWTFSVGICSRTSTPVASPANHST